MTKIQSRTVALQKSRETKDFDSGVEDLNSWLNLRALKNTPKNSQTYVMTVSNKVIGYYSLSASSVTRKFLPKNLQRNTPTNVPIILLGRLAVDINYQGQGIGKELLRDAYLRCLSAQKNIGASAIRVDALDQAASEFYKYFDFESSPSEPLILFLPLV